MSGTDPAADRLTGSSFRGSGIHFVQGTSGRGSLARVV